MGNENEVYIIEDIHPRDATYYRKEEFIGKKIWDIKFDNREWIPGWKGTSHCTIEDHPQFKPGIFLAIKVSPKKSFWQKLITWSW